MPQIRLATPADAVAVAGIYAHYVQRSPATFEEVAPTAADHAQRIADTLVQFPFYVADVDGVVVGYAYACPYAARASYRWGVTVGIYLHPDHRRAGHGRSLYAHLLPTLRRQGYVTAYAGITLPNDASVGLHQSLGFQLIGVYPSVGYKLGHWHDVGWWRLPLHPTFPTPPAEPTPFPQLP